MGALVANGCFATNGQALPATSDVLSGLLGAMPWIAGIAAVVLVIGIVAHVRSGKRGGGSGADAGADTQSSSQGKGRHSRP